MAATQKLLLQLEADIRAANDAQSRGLLARLPTEALQASDIPGTVVICRPALLPDLAKHGVRLDGRAFGRLFLRGAPEDLPARLDEISRAGIGLDLDTPMLPYSRDFPLDWSVESGQPLVADWLLARGAGQACNLDTLSKLLERGEQAMFELVVARGADLHAVGVTRRSLWHELAQRPQDRHPWAIAALRARNVPQSADIYGRTPRGTAVGVYFAEFDKPTHSLPEIFDLFEGDLWQDGHARYDIITGRRWAEIPQLLAMTPMPPDQYRLWWRELLSLWAQYPDRFGPGASTLIGEGIQPDQGQWTAILKVLLKGESEAIATFYAQAQHPTVRIPWRLKSVIKAGDVTVVQAWLRYHGFDAQALLLQSTGLLQATPPESWEATVRDLCKKQGTPRCQAAPKNT